MGPRSLGDALDDGGGGEADGVEEDALEGQLGRREEGLWMAMGGRGVEDRRGSVGGGCRSLGVVRYRQDGMVGGGWVLTVWRRGGNSV